MPINIDCILKKQCYIKKIIKTSYVNSVKIIFAFLKAFFDGLDIN